MISTAIVGKLAQIAARAGAPLIKSVLEKHAGPVAGSIAGDIIDIIADKVGAEPDNLHTVPDTVLESAVKAAEPESAELVLAHVEAQRETNRLFEMEHKEGFFAWGWRPAGMWTFIAMIVYVGVFAPLISAATGTKISFGLETETFLAMFVTYCTLYMGGHTAKDLFGKRFQG